MRVLGLRMTIGRLKRLNRATRRSKQLLRGAWSALEDRLPYAYTAPTGDMLSMWPASLESVLSTRESLSRILQENIVPFWGPAVLDLENGGYRLHHDLRGRWKGPAYRHIISQSRTVWFFSRLVSCGHGTEEHLGAARHGVEFLVRRMWDEQHGGFFWEVDDQGRVVAGDQAFAETKAYKNVRGQAYALFALSEYVQASGDAAIRQLAESLFDILERNAHDPEFGGYREFFERDWTPARPEAVNFVGNASANLKLMWTHLHALEALTAYYRMAGGQAARNRLLELIRIMSERVIREPLGPCLERFERDWTLPLGRRNEVVSFGHDLENLHFLIDACEAAGISCVRLLDLHRSLFAYAVRYGYDHEQGGFYELGRFDRGAVHRRKLWWVQAEALLAALQMFRLTGEPEYARYYLDTLNWIVNRQVDWRWGEWFAVIRPNGRPAGDKADSWKAPYHNARAMIEALRLLDELSDNHPDRR